MNSNIFEQLEVLDTKTLSTIEGGGYGAQCVVGTVGSVILGGALFGPFGAGAGVVGGSTAFCYSKVH
ncbi:MULTISPECIES: Blp family class II bacteriocin [Streptococcus]|jgi:hypothetical protein|uniref:Blp family class II bacteriocin n=1 Tax=Streptococcus TaxID=1301 RepID=UPI000890E0F7|nr:MULTISPECIES: Blp family class II bacteriocin [Streptococcus]SDJ30012.1 Bacteriocin class II with double-glycine leader peptide [Streptococcus equinus]SEQ13283.1 Bacteriocin class II with double-glycine leader peptide [Streptococcus equinus]